MKMDLSNVVAREKIFGGRELVTAVFTDYVETVRQIGRRAQICQSGRKSGEMINVNSYKPGDVNYLFIIGTLEAAGVCA